MLLGGKYNAHEDLELYIIFRRVKEYLSDNGIEIARSMVGEFLTVQEMAGFQMFVARMDDELLQGMPPVTLLI